MERLLRPLWQQLQVLWASQAHSRFPPAGPKSQKEGRFASHTAVATWADCATWQPGAGSPRPHKTTDGCGHHTTHRTFRCRSVKPSNSTRVGIRVYPRHHYSISPYPGDRHPASPTMSLRVARLRSSPGSRRRPRPPPRRLQRGRRPPPDPKKHRPRTPRRCSEGGASSRGEVPHGFWGGPR